MIVVALAGFPGSGESTLARALAAEFRSPPLDKDRVREALFGPLHVACSREQDDFCCEVLYQALAWLAQRDAAPLALLDGRTFTQPGQVGRLVACARKEALDLRVIMCMAPLEVLCARLTRAAEKGAHPARDRGPDLVRSLARTAVPLTVPHLLVDTHAHTRAEAVQCARSWIRAPPVS